jgi:hypothetical protein
MILDFESALASDDVQACQHRARQLRDDDVNERLVILIWDSERGCEVATE